ncbi:flagellar biosynthetic protein FliR [Photobacterium kishitanii]|uniref:Flagellar biosynthetic protein FliR n=1 Tax=Photobacterium kishitanii TaxID=318456 RepID=A0A2T3KMW8_9GAMM|nr:flagellar biosynthetic protein FliR [Photobacterium kishitanii]PSV01128.1 hypothetical protein C9J27_03655 [Photobacterium kishitanii]
MLESFLLDQSFSFVVSSVLIMVRLVAFFSIVPMINKHVPKKAMVCFCGVLTLIIAQRLSPLLSVEQSTYMTSDILLDMVRNSFIGFVYGVALLCVFEVITIMGTLIAYACQMGFASMLDPVNGTNNSVVSNLFMIMYSLFFVSGGGLLGFISFFGDSFAHYPAVGSNILSIDLHGFALQLGDVFSMALVLALPFIAASLLLNAGLAVISKMAPSFNLFSIGFPLCIMCFIMSLSVCMPTMLASINVSIVHLMEAYRSALSVAL